MWAHTHLAFEDLHGPWHGDRQNCTRKCQNGKIVHNHLGIAPGEWALRFAHVVCGSWGPMCISHIPYVVHWSMRQARTGELNIVHVGPKIYEMAENCHKCAHSWWQQMGHMSDFNRGVP